MAPPTQTARAWLGVVLATTLAWCGAPWAAPRTSAVDVEVLGALLTHGLGPDSGTLVIANETTGDPAALAADPATGAELVKQLGTPPDAFEDWARRNARREPLDRPLPLAVPYRLLGNDVLDELFEGVEPRQGWQQFFARYEGAPGLLRASRVGYDASGLHALVYVEHQCGAECGAGRLAYLVRENGAWTVKDAVIIWMTE